MNFPGFILLLVVGSTRRSSAADYGDGAEISNMKSMLRKSDPDNVLHQVTTKESNRDDSIPMAISIGNWVIGESIYQDERNLAKDCGPGKKYFKLDLKTDIHGSETSWTLSKKQNNTLVKIAAGPPSGTTYQDDHAYIGGYCLSAGTFKFTINDKLKDGMNGGNGGSYTGYVAGVKKFGSPIVESEWSRLVHEFSVTNSSVNSIPTDPDIATIDTTAADEKWLQAHNTRRKSWHTRYGKSYVPLQWSNALKAQSKAYAQDQLSTCGTVPLFSGNTTYGENIASNFGTGSYGEKYEPEQILIRWVDREADYGWPNNRHLTQALWRATKYVGCDVASKPFNGGMCHTQVCRYARVGNCNMGAYKSNQGDQKWLEPMLNEDRLCGPECPPDGC